MLPSFGTSLAIGPATMMHRLLLVDGDPATRQFVARALNGVGEVTRAATAREARQRFARCRPDLAILEARLPDGSGLDLLVELRRHWPRLPVRHRVHLGVAGDVCTRRSVAALPCS
jgi:CheY-like chemotaxis protein